MNPSHRTTRQALLYALREIARRAGVTERFLEQWRVRFEANRLVVWPSPDSDACVRFACDVSKPARYAQLRDAHASRYRSLRGQDDVVVLFEDAPAGNRALFEKTAETSIECHGDILTSTLWTLGRFEELYASERDEHERFPAAHSVLRTAGCLERPIVDEYGLELRAALSRLMPSWVPQQRSFRVKLSHDIDQAGVPHKLSTIAGHLYLRHLGGAFVQDVLSALGIGAPAYLQAAVGIAKMSERYGFTSAFYWQPAPPSRWDAGYDVGHLQIRKTIETLRRRGCEMGFHPGYATFCNFDELQAQLRKLRRVVGDGPVGGRQHYLRWRPLTWSDWERSGLVYDSSVGFPDAMGFRAGTCVPYHPWLFGENRESALLEIPLVVMDGTPILYMNLTPDAALERIAMLVARCKAVEGIFTLLWHNTSILEQPYAALYPRILQLLDGAMQYRWEDDAARWPVPLDVSLVSQSL